MLALQACWSKGNYLNVMAIFGISDMWKLKDKIGKYAAECYLCPS